LRDAAIRNEDHYVYNVFEAEKQVQDVVHKYADIVIKKSERKRKDEEEAVEKNKQKLKPTRGYQNANEGKNYCPQQRIAHHKRNLKKMFWMQN